MMSEHRLNLHVTQALMERRRKKLVVSRDLSVSISLSGERLDVLSRGLLSVMVVASRSRTAFPPAEVSLEAALPVSSQSAPPSVRVSNFEVFSRVMDEPVRDMLGLAVFATEDGAFLGDRGVLSHGDGQLLEIPS